jgi:hypothetical protein
MIGVHESKNSYQQRDVDSVSSGDEFHDADQSTTADLSKWMHLTISDVGDFCFESAFSRPTSHEFCT